MKETKELYLENLNRAIAFIENNLDKKILLQDIASAAFLSAYHFHRVFKSLTGETVKEFLIWLKIERAALRLKHSKDDIGQIALENGFENHQTFTRAFKRYFQTTPQAYREALQAVVMTKKTAYQNKALNINKLQVGEPIVKHLPDLHLAYIRHTGAYDKVAATFQRLML